ncbi:hypothetical protein Q4512_10355 [Oceanihabitans sp. 2_MG-2023]|uniref:hypothetical protein n=1 Tax=Oceanihabitans sp. 2_MG-2023 TaxID=3062661 RepID=UPI0026E457F6|nr:hypothetical protein [Oceanihabitans sp. 2_MG-2023]MDO6597314.1 hypothetical protein [Oceanihabitans sp. 2_MG-2023]
MHCSIHTNIHPMLGADIHLGTPGPPVVPVPMPHFVAQLLGGLQTSAKIQPTIMSHNFLVLNRGSDIGMGIGHVAGNILFPILVLTSGSVSEFGAFSVLSGGQPTAIAPLIYAGLNLNCSDPIPMNSINTVIAPGTNMAGFNFSDYLASVLSFAVDVFITGVANLIGAGLGKAAMGGTARLAGHFSVSAGLMTSVLFSHSFSGQVISSVVESTIGFFVGSPIGPAASENSPLSWVGDQADTQINEYMNDYYSQGENLN